MNYYLKTLFCCLLYGSLLLPQMSPIKSGGKRKLDDMSSAVKCDVLKVVTPVLALQELIWNYCNGFIELKELAVSLKAAETVALKEKYIQLFGPIITSRLYNSVSSQVHTPYHYGIVSIETVNKLKAIWDIRMPKQINLCVHISHPRSIIDLPQNCSHITYLRIASDEKSIAVACDSLEANTRGKVVMIFDREKNKLIHTYKNSQGPIAYSPDGKYIAMVKAHEQQHKQSQNNVVIDPTAQYTYFIYIIDRATHEILDTIPYRTSLSMLGLHAIDYIDFSLDSQHLLMMDGRLHIRVWKSELLKDFIPEVIQEMHKKPKHKDA
jgi:hypothetical protein